MYSVLDGSAPSGRLVLRFTEIGLPAGPLRTLAQARRYAQAGDKIVRWNRWGHCSKVWRMTERGTLQAIG